MENVIAFIPRQSNEQQTDEIEAPVASYGLLFITRSYNRGEISFNEWMNQSREWAESIIKQVGKDKDRPSPREKSGNHLRQKGRIE